MKHQSKFKETEIGRIPEDWDAGKIANLVKVVGGFAIKSNDFINEGIPVIKIKNIQENGSVEVKDVGFISEECFQNQKEIYKLEPGDFVIAMTGATIGKIGKIPTAYKKYMLNQRVARVISDVESDKQFVFQIFRSNLVQTAIQNYATGAAQANISSFDIEKINIPLPPKNERDNIAKILSDLDSKIELNHQMNKTLEAIGQAIFKRWFIDFEFPGYEKSEFVDGLPEGWRRGSFGELANIQPGFAFKSTDFTSGGYRVIKIANIQSGIVDFAKSDYVSDVVFQKTDNKFHLASGNVIIAMTGAKIGKIGIIPKNNEIMLLNQRVGKLVSDYFLWAYYVLKGVAIQSLIDGISSASSAQPNISNTDIEKTEVIIPNSQVLKNYCQILEPFYQKLIENLGENQMLSQIRDSLLPRLMSGKVRVN